MTLSCLFLMDVKGKVIINRNYRGDVPMSASERFDRSLSSIVIPLVRFAQYIQEKDEMDQRPIFTDDGFTFAYIKVRSDHFSCAAVFAIAQQSFPDVCNETQFQYSFSSHEFVSIGKCKSYTPLWCVRNCETGLQRLFWRARRRKH